jgi:hypothetical protein
MAVQTQIQTRRGTAASWTSTNPTLAAGEFGYESDTGKFKIGNGSTAWASLAYTAGATAVTYLFNATSGQTTFSGADANSLTLAYTVGAEQVYLNGVLQVRGSDYTATNGTSIVLTSGALTSDVLNVIAYSAMTITDTYTQAQADAKFFQTANEFSAGKNKFINGDFNINQRAFTSVTATGYTFDRWRAVVVGDGTSTFTPQTFTLGAAPVAGYEGKNFLRIVTTGQTATNTVTFISQRLESVRTFAGQTVTLSFWAKAGSGTPKIGLNFNQAFGAGGSPSSSVFGTPTTVTTSTSWVRYSTTFAIPSISGKTIGTDSNDCLTFSLTTSAGSTQEAFYGATGIQSATIDIWGVQVEAGSIATPFQTATGTLAGELAACQRYYFRTQPAASTRYLTGMAKTTTTTDFVYPYPVTMRTSPSALEQSGTAGDYGVLYQATGAVCSAVPVIVAASNAAITITFTVASGLTAGNATIPYAVNATGYLGWSAEL